MTDATAASTSNSLLQNFDCFCASLYTRSKDVPHIKADVVEEHRKKLILLRKIFDSSYIFVQFCSFILFRNLV